MIFFILSKGYPDTDVFVICYSIVDPNTFDNVASKWHIELKTHCPNVPIILVGTKKDLINDENTIETLKKKNQTPITSEQGYKMRQTIGAYAFVECSAKTQTGLNEVFTTAVEAVIDPRSRKSFQNPNLKDKKQCIVQ
jgi:GTPase SAR1 family protein